VSVKKVFLVEDHPIFRLGLKEIIEQEEDLTVCGEAADVEGALAGIERAAPDVVVVDIALKGGDGIDLIRELGRRQKNVPSLVLSMYEEEIYAMSALKAGARGYMMKERASDNVVGALRKILGGGVFLSEKLVGDLLLNFANRDAGEGADPVSQLTNRELEVFRLIGGGVPTRDIAKRLNLSVKTIGTHRERIKEKLLLKSGPELINYAVRWVSGHRPGG